MRDAAPRDLPRFGMSRVLTHGITGSFMNHFLTSFEKTDGINADVRFFFCCLFFNRPYRERDSETPK